MFFLQEKGDVLGAPDIGCNLDDLIFSLVFNEGVIAEKIMTQISRILS